MATSQITRLGWIGAYIAALSHKSYGDLIYNRSWFYGHRYGQESAEPSFSIGRS